MSTIFIVFFIFFSFFCYMPATTSGQDLYNWKYYLRKSRIEYKNEMYDFAIENLERTIRLNPSSYEAYNMLGYIYHKRRKYQKALEYFSTSLKIFHKQDEIHFLSGQIKDFYMETESATAHYRSAIGYNPNNIRAMVGLSRNLSIKGKRKESDTLFEKAFQKGKLLTITHYRDFNLSYKKNDHGSAIEKIKEIIKINPADREAYFTISTLYRYQKKPTRALLYLEKLKYIKPHDYKPYFHIGNIYYTYRMSSSRERELNMALKNLNKSIELKNDNQEAYEILLEIYRLKGDEVRAGEILLKLNSLK